MQTETFQGRRHTFGLGSIYMLVNLVYMAAYFPEHSWKCQHQLRVHSIFTLILQMVKYDLTASVVATALDTLQLEGAPQARGP